MALELHFWKVKSDRYFVSSGFYAFIYVLYFKIKILCDNNNNALFFSLIKIKQGFLHFQKAIGRNYGARLEYYLAQ